MHTELQPGADLHAREPQDGVHVDRRRFSCFVCAEAAVAAKGSTALELHNCLSTAYRIGRSVPITRADRVHGLMYDPARGMSAVANPLPLHDGEHSAAIPARTSGSRQQGMHQIPLADVGMGVSGMAAATGAAAPDSARLRSQRRRQHESMGKVSEWIAHMPALAYAPEIEEEIVTVDVGVLDLPPSVSEVALARLAQEGADDVTGGTTGLRGHSRSGSRSRSLRGSPRPTTSGLMVQPMASVNPTCSGTTSIRARSSSRDRLPRIPSRELLLLQQQQQQQQVTSRGASTTGTEGALTPLPSSRGHVRRSGSHEQLQTMEGHQQRYLEQQQQHHQPQQLQPVVEDTDVLAPPVKRSSSRSQLQARRSVSGLLAADGSRLQAGPVPPLPPLHLPLPSHVPYLVNSLGTPYGSCRGVYYPLVVSADGQVWWGPDGHPLLAVSRGQAQSSVRDLVTGNGAQLVGPCGEVVGVLLQFSVDISNAAPAAVQGLVNLATGGPLVNTDGQVLTVDPASLELQGADGKAVFDTWGQPLRLRPAPAADAAADGSSVGRSGSCSSMGGRTVSSSSMGRSASCSSMVSSISRGSSKSASGARRSLSTIAEPPSWCGTMVAIAGVALTVLLLAVLLLAVTMPRLLLVLLGVAPPLVVAGLLWLTASPASPLRRAASAAQPQPLAYQYLLDTSGNPLRDAKGRRLCLMQGPAEAPGAAQQQQQQLVTDTGDMVCVHVEAAAPEQMLVVKSLKCRKGGASKNLLLDDHGRRLLGKDSQLLQVLLDGHGAPLLSPWGFSAALCTNGRPQLGPDGQPLYLTPNNQLLLGSSGTPLLGPCGQMLQRGGGGELLNTGGAALVTGDGSKVVLGSSGPRLVTPDGAVLEERKGGGHGLAFSCFYPTYNTQGAAVLDVTGRPLITGPFTGATFTLNPANPLFQRLQRAQLPSPRHSRTPSVASRSGSSLASERSGQKLGSASPLPRSPKPQQQQQQQQGKDQGTRDAPAVCPDVPRSPPRAVPAGICYRPLTKPGKAEATSAGGARRSLAGSSSGTDTPVQDQKPDTKAQPAVLRVDAAGSSSGESSSDAPSTTAAAGKQVAGTAAAGAASGVKGVAAAGSRQNGLSWFQQLQAWAQENVWYLDWCWLLLQLLLPAPSISSTPPIERVNSSTSSKSSSSTARSVDNHQVQGSSWAGAAPSNRRGLGQAAVVLTVLLVILCDLTWWYPHERYLHSELQLTKMQLGLGSNKGWAGELKVPANPYALAAAAAAGTLPRSLTQDECRSIGKAARVAAAARKHWHALSQRVPELLMPRECGQSLVQRAVRVLFGGAAAPTSLVAGAARTLLSVWPLPHALVAACLVTVAVALYQQASKPALPAASRPASPAGSPVKRPNGSSSSSSTRQDGWQAKFLAGVWLCGFLVVYLAGSSCSSLYTPLHQQQTKLAQLQRLQKLWAGPGVGYGWHGRHTPQPLQWPGAFVPPVSPPGADHDSVAMLLPEGHQQAPAPEGAAADAEGTTAAMRGNGGANDTDAAQVLNEVAVAAPSPPAAAADGDAAAESHVASAADSPSNHLPTVDADGLAAASSAPPSVAAAIEAAGEVQHTLAAAPATSSSTSTDSVEADRSVVAPSTNTPGKHGLLRGAARAVGYCIWAPWWVATSPWRATHWLLSGLTGLEKVLLSVVLAVLGWQWAVQQEAQARKAARKVSPRRPQRVTSVSQAVQVPTPVSSSANNIVVEKAPALVQTVSDQSSRIGTAPDAGSSSGSDCTSTAAAPSTAPAAAEPAEVSSAAAAAEAVPAAAPAAAGEAALVQPTPADGLPSSPQAKGVAADSATQAASSDAAADHGMTSPRGTWAMPALRPTQGRTRDAAAAAPAPVPEAIAAAQARAMRIAARQSMESSSSSPPRTSSYGITCTAMRRITAATVRECNGSPPQAKLIHAWGGSRAAATAVPSTDEVVGAADAAGPAVDSGSAPLQQEQQAGSTAAAEAAAAAGIHEQEQQPQPSPEAGSELHQAPSLDGDAGGIPPVAQEGQVAEMEANTSAEGVSPAAVEAPAAPDAAQCAPTGDSEPQCAVAAEDAAAVAAWSDMVDQDDSDVDSVVPATWVTLLLGLASMVGDTAAVFAEMLWQVLQQASVAVAAWARHVGARIEERQEVRRASRPQQRKVRRSVGLLGDRL